MDLIQKKPKDIEFIHNLMNFIKNIKNKTNEDIKNMIAICVDNVGMDKYELYILNSIIQFENELYIRKIKNSNSDIEKKLYKEEYYKTILKHRQLEKKLVGKQFTKIMNGNNILKQNNDNYNNLQQKYNSAHKYH